MPRRYRPTLITFVIVVVWAYAATQIFGDHFWISIVGLVAALALHGYLTRRAR